jgi:hypothetical protein
MTKQQQNIDDHTAGDTLRIVVSVEDPSGTAVDITGSSIAWALAEAPGESPTVSKSTGDSSISITDATNGEFTVYVDSADTEGLSGVYYHEAELTDSSGNVHTVTTGYITISEETV